MDEIVSAVGMPMLIIGGLILMGALVALSFWMEQRRRETFHLLAGQLGLFYLPDRDRHLSEAYSFLSRLGSGSNEYAAHVFTGTFDEYRVTVFEHHYETHSTNSKGGRSTQHHYHAVYCLTLPRLFPEVTIGPEGILSKIAQAVGYDDIDFESAEFSRRFCVRSRDKRFAYDICHPEAIEFLLENPDLNLEIDGAALATVDQGRLAPEKILPALQNLVTFRRLIPEHLLQT